MKPRTSAPEVLLGRGSGSGPVGPDEAAVLLREQGVYLGPGRSSWQIGELLLTRDPCGGDRLWFVQPRGVLFDVPLERIVRVAVERRLYVVVRKPAMAVTWQDERLREPSTAWFLTPQLGQWVAQLHAALGGEEAEVVGREERGWGGEKTAIDGQGEWVRGGAQSEGSRQAGRAPGGLGLGIGGMKPASHAGQAEPAHGRGVEDRPLGRTPGVGGRVLRTMQASAHTGNLAVVTAGALERVARQAGPMGRLILEHLAAVGHASLRELVAVTGARSDSEVLFCIRQGINPAAQVLLGRPILHFVEAQVDLVTGEPAAFEWWLAGSRGRSPQPVAVEAEVFEEAERLTVVLEMVGAEAASVRCAVAGAKLTVTASGPRQGWRSEVVLPCTVVEAGPAVQVRNGVVSIVLVKAG